MDIWKKNIWLPCVQKDLVPQDHSHRSQTHLQAFGDLCKLSPTSWLENQSNNIKHKCTRCLQWPNCVCSCIMHATEIP